MVSLQGYNESYDYRHMYDIKDLSPPLFPGYSLKDGTIFEFLSKLGNYSKMIYLIELAGMIGMVNSYQGGITLFVVRDCDIPDDFMMNLKRGDARRILLFNMIKKELPMRFLRSSPIMKIYTALGSEKLLVENNEGVTTINYVPIIQGDIKLCNDIVHVLSCLNIPDDPVEIA